MGFTKRVWRSRVAHFEAPLMESTQGQHHIKPRLCWWEIFGHCLPSQWRIRIEERSKVLSKSSSQTWWFWCSFWNLERTPPRKLCWCYSLWPPLAPFHPHHQQQQCPTFTSERRRGQSSTFCRFSSFHSLLTTPIIIGEVRGASTAFKDGLSLSRSY